MTGLAMAAAAVLSLSLAPVAYGQDAPSPAAPAAPAVPAAPLPTVSESVAAIVNDDIVSTYDLVQRMRLLVLTAGMQPTQENLPQLQREALRGLIEERLELQELRRVEVENKIEIIASDEEVDEAIADMARGANNMTAEQLLAQLRAAGIGPETLRAQLRAEISWQGYISGRFRSRLRIGRDQIKATLDRLAAQASKPQYQISEVYIEASRVGGMQVAYQGAQTLIDQMQQGAPFAAVARQFSSSPTAASGGAAGWIGAGEMPTEVDSVLEQMGPGQLSPPIATRDGVYIIFLHEKRSGSSVQMVTLKQIAVPMPEDASAEQVQSAANTLEGLRSKVTGCADLEAKAGADPAVLAGDLGEAEITSLAEGFQQAIAATPDGQLSQAIRTPLGLHLVMVCGRRASGERLPTPEQVEARLMGVQLSNISKRILRDLRTSATIETR
ncbi:MAG: peptidylprolyl isomerase [Caulobacter sp.]|nr:peptidylprolyl isomerase [Caulobacter sp.]